MENIFSILSAIILLGITIRYAYQILKKRIEPVFTTWLLFSVATGLSLLTYFFSDTHSLAGNIINVMDVVFCFTFLFSLTFVLKKRSLIFTSLEKSCLYGTGAILIFWIFTEQSLIANLLLQLILIIAFIPTVTKLWKAREIKESLIMWVANGTASGLGLVSGIIKNDFLGSVYALRSFALISLIVILLIRSRKYEIIKQI